MRLRAHGLPGSGDFFHGALPSEKSELTPVKFSSCRESSLYAIVHKLKEKFCRLSSSGDKESKKYALSREDGRLEDQRRSPPTARCDNKHALDLRNPSAVPLALLELKSRGETYRFGMPSDPIDVVVWVELATVTTGAAGRETVPIKSGSPPASRRLFSPPRMPPRISYVGCAGSASVCTALSCTSEPRAVSSLREESCRAHLTPLPQPKTPRASRALGRSPSPVQSPNCCAPMASGRI
jgi:hypothetical protein